ncbi:hypothetical protein GCM10010219_25830 [Streptomyces netropsis]|nr:hypothetical protein GCM10010219_25830 [Streptomyces netropsis]
MTATSTEPAAASGRGRAARGVTGAKRLRDAMTERPAAAGAPTAFPSAVFRSAAAPSKEPVPGVGVSPPSRGLSSSSWVSRKYCVRARMLWYSKNRVLGSEPKTCSSLVVRAIVMTESMP